MRLAATRARRSRRTAGTWRSSRRVPGRNRFSRFIGMGPGFVRSRGPVPTGFRTGRNNRAPDYRFSAQMTSRSCFSAAVFVASAVALGIAAQQPPAQPTPPPKQQSEVAIVIGSGDPSLPPKIAVPPFIALTNDSETQAAATTIGEVLWNDLQFEKEFYMIPRDTYRTVPSPTSIDDVPLDRWKELGADGVLIGSVRKTPTGVTVQFRLINVASGASAMAREYSGSATSLQINECRVFAHTIADEVHKE